MHEITENFILDSSVHPPSLTYKVEDLPGVRYSFEIMNKHDLVCHLDRLHGVQTIYDSINDELKKSDCFNNINLPQKYRPSHAYYRKPASEPMETKKLRSKQAISNEVLKINLLLRALSTLQGVLHVLPESSTLKTQYTTLCKNILNIPPDQNIVKKLHAEESAFNTKVLECFLKSKKITHPENPKECKDFLKMLRYLSQTLEDAPAIISEMEINKKTVELIDIPITQKTKTQQTIEIYQSNNDNHTYRKDLIDHFKDKITDSKTQLSSQTRDFYSPTVKNGFRSLIRVDNTTISDFVRSGSLYSIEPEQTDQARQATTKENIEQIKSYYSANKDATLTSIVLNTNLPFGGSERQIVKGLLSAAGNSKHKYIVKNIAVNPPGVLFTTRLGWLIIVAATLTFGLYGYDIQLGAPRNMSQLSFLSAAFILGITLIVTFAVLYRMARATTYLEAANAVVSQCMSNQDHILHVQCKSGQDRTGLVLLMAYTDRIAHATETKSATVEEKLAIGLHYPQFMATIAAPGSEGLKKVSRAKGTLHSSYGDLLFPNVANTNKKAPFDKAKISTLLAKSQESNDTISNKL